MISIKSPREIEAMRRAGRITAQARALAGSMVAPGVTTHEIDTAVRRSSRATARSPPSWVTAATPVLPASPSMTR